MYQPGSQSPTLRADADASQAQQRRASPVSVARDQFPLESIAAKVRWSFRLILAATDPCKHHESCLTLNECCDETVV